MTEEELQREIFKIISEQLGVTEDSIKLESKFKEDLGADSLDTVEMVMALEDHFQIEIEDEEAEKMDSPAKVVEFIKKLK